MYVHYTILHKCYNGSYSVSYGGFTRLTKQSNLGNALQSICISIVWYELAHVFNTKRNLSYIITTVSLTPHVVRTTTFSFNWHCRGCEEDNYHREAWKIFWNLGPSRSYLLEATRCKHWSRSAGPIPPPPVIEANCTRQPEKKVAQMILQPYPANHNFEVQL